ncbi:cytochrome C [Aquamicrobium zhengzhouense]|nr:cytochrome C [Aquamicrobium zhengzhouense]
MPMRHVVFLTALPLVFVAAASAISQTPERMPNIAEITQWARSGHANVHSESFAHWNDAGQIPPVCATCHSGAGFRSLYGFDGSEPGLPQTPVPVGGVVDCDTCHNPALPSLTEIQLPSGLPHPVTGFEGACMTCHQGRASTATIEKSVGASQEDEVNPELGFVNPHYAIAGATLLGGDGALGYHYAGKEYEPRFFHARPVATCVSCHEPHNLTVAEEVCTTCHETGDPKAIRISRQSFDGSGDLGKGIHADIVANRQRLFGLVQDYAREVIGTPMIYDGGRYPYFFADHNSDGRADEKDGAPVAYTSWTPRLLKAAYNWKFVGADGGIHVHNPHYALQLLYDSAEDLSSALGRELTGMSR